MSTFANPTGKHPVFLQHAKDVRTRHRISKGMLLRDFSCKLERPISHFFELRCLSNSPCSIVHQSTERTYYGYTEAEQRTGNSLYFVSTDELCRAFPTHQSIDGTELHRLVKDHLSTLCPAHRYRLLQSFPFVPFLQRDGIEINVDWQYTVDSQEPVQLSLCLFLGWDSSAVQRLY